MTTDKRMADMQFAFLFCMQYSHFLLLRAATLTNFQPSHLLTFLDSRPVSLVFALGIFSNVGYHNNNYDYGQYYSGYHIKKFNRMH